MQIAQVMAGYSLGEADLLRRAMGKKDKAEMAKQQARFVEGAKKNGVRDRDAVHIFELVDKFAGYGFNKSHAAAYAVVSYHTAYLKANFPEEFLAASMTLDMAHTDKLAMFATEAKKSGIAVRPPCVNASHVEFGVELPERGAARGAIRYSLAALKNIGAASVATIAAEREANGLYTDLADFAGRMTAKALNKRALETLAAAGAFDALDRDRARAHGNTEALMAFANRLSADAKAGTSDLFGGGGKGGSSQKAALDLRGVQPWTPIDRLQHEFESVGFYLSGHPLDQYEGALEKLGLTRYTDFLAAAERGATVGRLAGIVVSARERRSQKGNKFAFAMFSDASGEFEAVIFSDTLADCRPLLEPGTPVLISVEAERDGEAIKLRVQNLEALDKAAAQLRRGLRIVLDPQAMGRNGGGLAELKALLKPGGKGEIRVVLPLPDRAREMEFVIPGGFDVSPRQAGILATAPGVRDVAEV